MTVLVVVVAVVVVCYFGECATGSQGSFFKEWAPVEHPQLGPVEVGGFKYKRLTQNPPEQMLRAE